MHHAYSIPLRWLRVFVAPLVVAFAVGLVPTAASAASPQAWHVAAGAQTPDEAIQGNVFLNNNITIHTGDTVDWTIKSGEPHTISFFAPSSEPFFATTGTGCNGQLTVAQQCSATTAITSPGSGSTPRHVRPALSAE